MTPKNFRKYRLLFVKDSCPHCHKYMNFIEKINQRLPINKRIKIINCSLYHYGVYDTILSFMNENVKGFPTLMIDGILIDGINTSIESESFLKSYLEDEYISPEYSNYKFIKDCEFNNKGFFKGKVICR